MITNQDGVACGATIAAYLKDCADPLTTLQFDAVVDLIEIAHQEGRAQGLGDALKTVKERLEPLLDIIKL